MADRLDLLLAKALERASPDQQLWAGIQLKRWQLIGLLGDWLEPVSMVLITGGTLLTLTVPRFNQYLTNVYQSVFADVANSRINAKGTAPVFPVPGMSWGDVSISSEYGEREIFGSTSFHHGVDIALSVGTPIVAPEAGIISRVWEQPESGGKVVELTPHSNKSRRLKFLHLSKQLAKEGDQVVAGQEIAKSGNSGGRSTGPHLDFRIKEGDRWINPTQYLKTAKRP